MTQIEKIEKKISELSPKLLKNLNNYIDGMIINRPKIQDLKERVPLILAGKAH